MVTEVAKCHQTTEVTNAFIILDVEIARKKYLRLLKQGEKGVFNNLSHLLIYYQHLNLLFSSEHIIFTLFHLFRLEHLTFLLKTRGLARKSKPTSLISWASGQPRKIRSILGPAQTLNLIAFQYIKLINSPIQKPNLKETSRVLYLGMTHQLVYYAQAPGNRCYV